MAKNKMINCAECGGSITIEDGMTQGFCLHCGQRFNLDAQPDAEKPILDHALELFEKKDWPALVAYTAQTKDPDFVALCETARLYMLYEDYGEDAAELSRQTARKGVMQFFTGRNTYGEDPMHRVFYDNTKERIDIVAELMESGRIDPALQEKVAESIAERLLSVEKELGTPTYWSLVANEQSVTPLLPFLSLEALQQLYTTYKKVNPDNQSLPNQMVIKKTMEQAIVDKGGEVPKKKRFGK